MGLIVVAMLLPTVAIAVALRIPAVAAAVLRAVRERRAEPQPANEPFERVAAEVRRLRALVDAQDAAPRGEVPAVRRSAVRRAYEDRLVAACRILELPQNLAVARRGGGWADEVARVERELAEAGLSVRLERRLD